MKKEVNNPMAFPSQEIDYQESAIQGRNVICSEHTGMTLRDYFAAKAMSQFLANHFRDRERGAEHPGSEWRYYLAEASYRIADAMLEAREQ